MRRYDFTVLPIYQAAASDASCPESKTNQKDNFFLLFFSDILPYLTTKLNLN